MSDFTFAAGTHDPHGFSVEGKAEGLVYAVGYIETRHAGELVDRPAEVVTLMGRDGLVTRPSEHIDEFVKRVSGEHLGIDPNSLQPGDTNTPDCNGD